MTQKSRAELVAEAMGITIDECGNVSAEHRLAWSRLQQCPGDDFLAIPKRVATEYVRFYVAAYRAPAPVDMVHRELDTIGIRGDVADLVIQKLGEDGAIRTVINKGCTPSPCGDYVVGYVIDSIPVAEGNYKTTRYPTLEEVAFRRMQPLHGRIDQGVLTVTVGMDHVGELFSKRGLGLGRASGALSEDSVVTSLFNGSLDIEDGETLEEESLPDSPWENALIEALGIAHDNQDVFEDRQRKDREETEF